MSFFDLLSEKIGKIKENITYTSENMISKIKEKGSKYINKAKLNGEIIINKIGEGKDFIVEKIEKGISEIKTGNKENINEEFDNENETLYENINYLYDEYPNVNLKKNKNKTNNKTIKNINNYKSYDEIFQDGFIPKPKIEDNWGICPITNCYMENPVLTPYGQYYEKNAILKWLEKNKTDPVTRENLTKEMLVEDLDFKREIIEYKFINDIE